MNGDYTLEEFREFLNAEVNNEQTTIFRRARPVTIRILGTQITTRTNKSSWSSRGAAKNALHNTLKHRICGIIGREIGEISWSNAANVKYHELIEQALQEGIIEIVEQQQH